MKIKCNVKMGGNAYQFNIDERDEMESLHKAIVLTNPKKKCGVCGDIGYENKYFTTNKDKEGNVYVNVKCKCGARSKLGQYKAGGYFWHEYEVWEGKAVKSLEEEIK